MSNDETEQVQATEVDIAPVTEAQERAQIDRQIATAQKYPRDINSAKNELVELAARDPEIAEDCFYHLERDGNPIDGESVRLAEIVEYVWGNIRCQTRVVDIGEKFVTAEAQAADLQRNNAVRAQHRRRITTSSGRRYGDDMIQVTANAAMSIAYRNAIFKLVPPAVLKPEIQKIQQARYQNVSLEERIQKAITTFYDGWGVEKEKLLDYLGRTDWDAVDHDDVDKLRGLAQALREGTTSVEESFGEKEREQEQEEQEEEAPASSLTQEGRETPKSKKEQMGKEAQEGLNQAQGPPEGEDAGEEEAPVEALIEKKDLSKRAKRALRECVPDAEKRSDVVELFQRIGKDPVLSMDNIGQTTVDELEETFNFSFEGNEGDEGDESEGEEGPEEGPEEAAEEMEEPEGEDTGINTTAPAKFNISKGTEGVPEDVPDSYENVANVETADGFVRLYQNENAAAFFRCSECGKQDAAQMKEMCWHIEKAHQAGILRIPTRE